MSDIEATPRHDEPAKEFRLGVLLVHGIGTQPPRDTLVRWGDALLKVIGQATRHAVIASVTRGRPGDGSGDKPAEVAVELRAAGDKEKWLLAEGWWADTFPAPTYAELVSWSLRAVPWSIAIHIAQGYWRSDPEASRGAKAVTLAMAIGRLVVALALAPLFVLLLVLALVLGLLPIPQIRSLILSAQSRLTGTVGDSLAFVESPMRAALIRTRILEGLERLKAQCDRTIIVAHSQGAAASLDALGGIMQSDVAAGDGLAERPAPDTLLTFGAGINPLVSLKALSAGVPKALGVNPASFAVGALLVTAGLSAFIGWSIWSGQIGVPDLLEAAGLWAATLMLAALLLWGTHRLLGTTAGRSEATRKRVSTIEVAVGVVTMLGAVVGGLVYAELRDLPFGPVSFLALALLILTGSLSMILSRSMAIVVTAPVRKPPGLTRWIDLYASHDLVPNGPTRIAEAGSVESVPVWNRASVLADHTTYWDNLDGFVLRVVRACADTAASPWREALAPETSAADRRAAWRAGHLRRAHTLNALGWSVAFALLWTRHGALVPLPLELPSWLPPGSSEVVRFAVLAALVAAAGGATSALMSGPWRRWVRAEQEAVLNHADPGGTPWAPFIEMGMVVSGVLLVAYAATRDTASMLREFLADPWETLFGLLMMMTGMAGFLAAIARWLWPAR